ncbi:MAG TPA: hypothetical protein VL947_10910 [Cytophagales bacterium]|nr:hypothetical protein [Cytophagales bacterium]
MSLTSVASTHEWKLLFFLPIQILLRSIINRGYYVNRRMNMSTYL